MVYIDDSTKEKLESIKLESIYFLVNFDNVITDYNSQDTWDIIIGNYKFKKRQIKEMEELSSKFKKIELDNNLEFRNKCNLVKDVWQRNIDIIKKLNIDSKKLNRLINDKGKMNMRNGAKEFFEFTHEKNIPIIIISDGILEVIKAVFDCNKCNYDNIYIVSNSIFEKDVTNLVIHPLNKNELSVHDEIKDAIQNKNNCILLTSSISDINMLSKSNVKDSIKIAFLDKNINENFDLFLNYFNMIFTHNTSFEIMTNKLKEM